VNTLDHGRPPSFETPTMNKPIGQTTFTDGSARTVYRRYDSRQFVLDDGPPAFGVRQARTPPLIKPVVESLLFDTF
jgi:hypothetical protein